MSNDTNMNMLFYEYYAQWIEVYKRGAIREATMAKYLMTQKWVEKLVPELRDTERRIRSGATPASFSCSSLSWRWV